MAQPGTSSVTLSAYKSAFKELFPGIRVEQCSLRDRDLFRWMPKDPNFTGYAVDDSGGWYHIPVRYSKPQGMSYFFGEAQTKGGAAEGKGLVKSFKLPRKRYYGYLTIDEEAIAASRSKNGAFYSVKESETEDLIASVSEELEKHLWGGSGGALGQVQSISTTTITLYPGQAGNFHIGMSLGFNTAADGSGTDKADAVATVTAVNYSANTITTSADLSDDTAAVEADHYIFRAGSSVDVSATGDAGNMVLGLGDWIPLTAETSGTFLEVSRTDAVEYLQGWRKSDQGSIEETIKALHSDMISKGAKPDAIWMSYASWFRLEQELGSRAYREDGKAGNFGLPTLKFMSAKGPIPVYAGSFCPDDRFYMLKRNSWKFLHLGPVPHLVMSDGVSHRVMTGVDALEVRCRYWGNLACFKPFDNGVGGISV